MSEGREHNEGCPCDRCIFTHLDREEVLWSWWLRRRDWLGGNIDPAAIPAIGAELGMLRRTQETP